MPYPQPHPISNSALRGSPTPEDYPKPEAGGRPAICEGGTTSLAPQLPPRPPVSFSHPPLPGLSQLHFSQWLSPLQGPSPLACPKGFSLLSHPRASLRAAESLIPSAASPGPTLGVISFFSAALWTLRQSVCLSLLLPTPHFLPLPLPPQEL